jgi:hypothetical protein
MKSSRLLILGSLVLASLAATPALADLSTCENVYVGRIWVERGHGLRAVVFLNNANDASGSYWAYFDNWTADEKKSALATLTAAKLAGHRVHVTTDDAGGCAILTGGSQIKMVYLATNQ